MKFGVKTLLGIAVLSALVTVYFADEFVTAKKEQEEQEKAVALYFENKDCLKFSMQNMHGAFVFERKNFESPWRMISPKNVMADQDAVNSTLVLLRNISIQRVLQTQMENNRENYGLDAPLLRFEITLNNEEKTTKILSFGKNLNDNTTSGFQFPSAYAQLSGRTNILVVDNSSLPSFHEKKYEDFRTKQIAEFKPADVAKITVFTQTKIELNYQNHEWNVVSPQPAAADNTFIFKYIQMFHELTADQVVDTADAKGLKAKGINLDNPAASVTFADSKGADLQKFLIFMSKSGLFVRMPDDSFAQIDLSQWPDLVPKLKYFRNRSVMLGADVRCDDDLNTLIADDIIDNLSNDDLRSLGFDKPLKTLSCPVSKKRKGTKNLEVLIGNRVPYDEKNVYVKRSDSNTVYIVNSESLSKLAQLKPL